MPRARFERISPEKREAILTAAAAEFAAHGYEAASVNRIIDKADLSKGSFYYYFDDKADLAAAVVEDESKRFLDDIRFLERSETRRDFWRGAERLVEATQDLQRRRPQAMDALTRLGSAAAKDLALAARLQGPAMQTANKAAAAFWKRGQELGVVRDDIPVSLLTQLLLGVKMTLTALLLPHDQPVSATELKRFIELHFDLVRRVAEKKKRPTRSKGRRS